VPAGHYWTRETGLVDYYAPEWDCDDYSAKLEDAAEAGADATNRFATAEGCKAALEEAVIRRCMADARLCQTAKSTQAISRHTWQPGAQT